MEKNAKPKCKRRRLNPTHRWTELETVQLIGAVADETKDRLESFEKPTAERFYEKIKSKAPTLEKIEWMSLKCKMRYLKALYVSAVDWKDNTGSGLLSSGDETSVSTHVQHLCPNFDLFANIFGQRKNVSPSFVYDSQTDVELLTDPCDSVSNELLIKVEKDSDVEHIPKTQTSTPLRSTNNIDLIQRKTKRKSINNSYPFDKLVIIQEKKLDLEIKKLEFEKEKEQYQIEIKKLELKNAFDIRKLELQMQKEERLEIEKLRLECEEKMKKYEIDSRRK